MDVMEWTPLMHAARYGEVETVQKLLKSKEENCLKNKMGADLITLSAASGMKSVFKIILGEMKNMSTDNTVDLSCALRVAALFGHMNIVQFILNAKCDPNAKDPMSGATALMLATSCGHYSVVRLLLAYGALADSTNVYCQSAIDIAESKQYNDLVELLKTKEAYDCRKVLPTLLMPSELPKIDYTVRELSTKSASSFTANRCNYAPEELLSPQTTCTPEFENTCNLSPVTLLPIYDDKNFSPSNILSENLVCKRTIGDKTKQIFHQSNEALEIVHSCNSVHHYLSPHKYHLSKNVEIPKEQNFSRQIDNSIQGEKLHENFGLSTKKMFQYDSFSQPSSPYSPSPTSRNVFSQSDPSVIYELNGGNMRRKDRKKAFWHGIRRRVRSLAHDKNGYHFFHPYCDSADTQECIKSSPHIQRDDELKLKTTEADSEGEKDNSPCKTAVSPLSSSFKFEKSNKITTKSIQEKRQMQNDFKKFLYENGLHHFIDIFINNEIDLMTFFELHDMDLREIGINSSEDRSKILNVIDSQYCCI